MKKILLFFTTSLLLIACNKESVEETDVSAVVGTYRGDSQVWGPVSCITGEGGAAITVSTSGRRRIWIKQQPHGNYAPFVVIPNVGATLIEQRNGVYYFRVDPFDDGLRKAGPDICNSDNSINYNIAIFPDRRIDMKMSYYNYERPQGEQYFRYAGLKE